MITNKSSRTTNDSDFDDVLVYARYLLRVAWLTYTIMFEKNTTLNSIY